jgi:26S proteasome regulatory subunit N2
MLRYVLNEAISGTSGNENWPIDFRADVRLPLPLFFDAGLMIQLFKILLRLFQRSPVPDWSSMTIIWVQSRAAGPTVEALGKLCAANDHAQAYQIAFDLYEIAPQGFVTEVRQGLVQSGLGPDQALVSITLFDRESANELGRK